MNELSFEPRIQARPIHAPSFQAALAAGYSPLLARVIAGRAMAEPNADLKVQPTLDDLSHPGSLPDIESAAKRIAKAVLCHETIAINTDFDVDGSSSAAVLLYALEHLFGLPPEHIQFYVGHRLKEGYGLSDPVADRILEAPTRPTLVVTADHGSSDEARIARLAEAGIEVIVTDHHGIPTDGVPRSASCVVSPAREDSSYPDRTICGAMVAFLLVCAVRKQLMALGYFESQPPPLASLLGYVGLATVADCVDLRSVNNRAVILSALRQINAGQRPCWRVFKQRTGHDDKPVTAETLAFSLAPYLNSRSRVDDATVSVRFLLSTTDQQAHQFWDLLEQANNERKAIEKAMKSQAVAAVAPTISQGQLSIVYFGGKDFSAGVHGIVASRLVEQFGRVTALFSPDADAQMITGSCRSIPGCHVRNALDHVAAAYPDMLVRYGGHAGAAGLKIRCADLDTFRTAFEHAVAQQITTADIGPRLFTDGELNPEDIRPSLLDELDQLEPFGREFEATTFVGEFRCDTVKRIGDGTHLKLTLESRGHHFDAIWFRAQNEDDPPAIAPGQNARFVFAPRANHWRGEKRLQLVVAHAADISTPAVANPQSIPA